MKIVFLFICTLFAVRCHAGPLSDAQNQFALELFSEVSSKEPDNLVFSPYSIYSNLALLYFGAADTTAQEIGRTLHLSQGDEKFLESFHKQLITYSNSQEKAGYVLATANGIFPGIRTQILPSFQTVAEKFFEAKVEPVDYSEPEETIEIINQWIRERTEQKISSFLKKDDIDSATKLILANAVYLQANWAFPFDSRETKPGSFYSANDTPNQVNMMHQIGKFSYFEDEQVQGVILPFYRSGVHYPRIDCLLLLPKQNFEGTLSFEKLSYLLKNAKQNRIDLSVPKFCFNFRMLLNDYLEKLGMQEAFSDHANLSKINGLMNLSVQRVIHNTFFSFQENGVTAASSTTTHIGVTSVKPDESTPISFIADRPFFFIVFDHHSHNILFLGHVVHPSSGECNED